MHGTLFRNESTFVEMALRDKSHSVTAPLSPYSFVELPGRDVSGLSRQVEMLADELRTGRLTVTTDKTFLYSVRNVLFITP